MKRKREWWIYTGPVIILLSLILYVIMIMRPGGMTGVLIFYLVPFFGILLSLIFLIIGIIKSIRNKPFYNQNRLIGFLLLVSVFFSGYLFDVYPSSFDSNPSKVDFRLPLDGNVAVAWGGGTEDVNYHVVAPDQKWAYDLLVIKENKSYKGDSSKLENYYCYDLPVLAPADGKVIKVFDKDPDMPIGVLGGGTDAVGNHVIIEVAPQEFLFICHLKPKSILVKKGDRITQGQHIANVGNSGNTSEPHIHMHLQHTKISGIGEGIPLQFSNYVSNGKVIKRGIPKGGFDSEGQFKGEIVSNN